MEKRELGGPSGRLGRSVSVIGLGTWQIGADWGDVDEDSALALLEKAVDLGVDFLDTADVYGDGRSERLIGELLRRRPDAGLFVATKMGRRAEQRPENFTLENFRGWTERSRTNLGVEILDLVQLHCPPSAVYGTDDVFDALDVLVTDGIVKNYGVSIETVAEGLAAVERPNVASIQVIVNAFRRKPLEILLPAAHAAGVAIIARVPLASGLLSGRYTKTTEFAATDHRSFNRHGEAFDQGETFAGVDFETGLRAVERLRPLVPEGASLAQLSLRWLISNPAVSVVIPGARTVAQVESNVAAAALLPLSDADLRTFRAVYDEEIRDHVHDRW
jgi:aryl-alcohol dehydrogenase-like predicted oxidoreductase